MTLVILAAGMGSRFGGVKQMPKHPKACEKNRHIRIRQRRKKKEKNNDHKHSFRLSVM